MGEVLMSYTNYHTFYSHRGFIRSTSSVKPGPKPKLEIKMNGNREMAVGSDLNWLKMTSVW